MAAKYHIKDDGMPGICHASNSDSCPKTQAGDSFHGTLDEATKEAETRFEAKLGAFVTSSKSAEDKVAIDQEWVDEFSLAAQRFIENPTSANQKTVDNLRNELAEKSRSGEASGILENSDYERAEIALSKAAAGIEIYSHPQGKTIEVSSDGTVRAYKNGREVSTSATAEKLRSGYGAWKRESGLSAAAAMAPQGALTPEQQESLVGIYDGATIDRDISRAALDKIINDQNEYDRHHAVDEGRVSYMDYSKGYDNRERKSGFNPNPRGVSTIVPLPEQKRIREEAFDRWRAAVDHVTAQQTVLEGAGLGHRIPDAGNTIRVNTQAQKWMLVNELQGQISDGHWENTSGNPWQDWSNAKVIVDPQNPGRNFHTRKDNYQLNSQQLLDVVGDRMMQDVRDRTGNGDYDEKAMRTDLADLRKIFKTKRDQVEG